MQRQLRKVATTASGVTGEKDKLSRKDLLAQYRHAKDSGTSNKENLPKPKPKEEAKPDLKMKMKKATSTTIAPPRTAKRTSNKEKIELAGREKIGPTTPIGKLKRRLQSSQPEPQKPLQVAPQTTTRRSLEDLHEKLLEVNFLTQSHGTKIARSFLENLKTQEGFEWVVSKAIYWLACIKLEIKDRKWERVEELFSLADGSLQDSSDRSALSVAYDEFKESTAAALKNKLKFIQGPASAPPLPTPQSDSLTQLRDPPPPTNPFQNVNVSSIRSMFEKNAESVTTQSSIATTNLSSTSRNNKWTEPLPQGKPLNRKLVGGVPLIGLTTAFAVNAAETDRSTAETNPERERNLELLLLGIGPFEESVQDSPIKLKANSPEADATKRKNCGSQRSVSVRLEPESDEEITECDKKRVRREESVPRDLSSKKSLRFDCSTADAVRDGSSTAKPNRKGTPYKHSRRKIED